MAHYNAQVDAATPWCDGSVSRGDTKTIEVQTLATASNPDSAGGMICNQGFPARPNGPMHIDGALIVRMNYPLSTIRFGYGVGSTPEYTRPVISATGSVSFAGTGAYDGSNFVELANTTHNYGVMTFSNISLYSPDSAGVISGTGTLNLENCRFFGNNRNYNAFCLDSISGGQVINMNGSDLSVRVMLSDVTINMHGGSNYLALRPTMTVQNVTISGFGRGDIIDVPFTSADDSWVYDPATGMLTITSTGFSQTVTIGLGYDPSKFQSVPTGFPGMKGVTYLDPAPCFLSGTLIATPAGEVPVETLHIGDLVRLAGDEAPCRITGILRGKIHTRLISNLPPDQAGYAVCIRKDAFDDGVPHRDLHVTSEHCFLFDGAMVPVRMLVNGGSIVYRTDIESYDYLHLQCERHVAIIANGARTESHRRDGTGSALPLGERYPVCTDRAFVQPLYERLVARSSRTGFSAPHPAPTTHDGDLHLGLGDGRITRPLRRNGRQVLFLLPEAIRTVRIMSRVARPCDTTGPFMDDRRHLGVLIGEISLFDSIDARKITTHLSADALPGWEARENGSCRWTRGNALLTLPEQASGTMSILSLEVLSEGPYEILDTAETPGIARYA